MPAMKARITEMIIYLSDGNLFLIRRKIESPVAHTDKTSHKGKIFNA
jgi:hypothetical protein